MATPTSNEQLESLRRSHPQLVEFLRDTAERVEFGSQFYVDELAWERIAAPRQTPAVKRVRFSDLAKASKEVVNPADEASPALPQTEAPRPVAPLRPRDLFLQELVSVMNALNLTVRTDDLTRRLIFKALKPRNLMNEVHQMQNDLMRDGLTGQRVYISPELWQTLISNGPTMQQAVSPSRTITGKLELMGMEVVLVRDRRYLRVEGGVFRSTPKFSMPISVSPALINRPDLAVAGSSSPAIIQTAASTVPRSNPISDASVSGKSENKP